MIIKSSAGHISELQYQSIRPNWMLKITPNDTKVDGAVLLEAHLDSSLKPEILWMLSNNLETTVDHFDCTTPQSIAEADGGSKARSRFQLSVHDYTLHDRSPKDVLVTAWVTESRYLAINIQHVATNIPCLKCLQAYSGLQATGASERDQFHTLNSLKLVTASALVVDCVYRAVGIIDKEEFAKRTSTLAVYDMQAGTSVQRFSGRVPGCSLCWRERTQQLKDIGSYCRLSGAAIFDENARLQIATSHHQMPGSAHEHEETGRDYVYGMYPTIALPDMEALYSRRRKLANGQMTFAHLATLLFLSFGRWPQLEGQVIDRVQPSAGNLGSPKAFVVVNNITGIEPGIYVYLEKEHRLALLGKGIEVSPTQQCNHLINELFPASLDTAIIISGSYKRISRKYGAFGYRLIHMDCGYTASYIKLVVQSFGFSSYQAMDWPERSLAAELLLNPEANPIVAIIGVAASSKKNHYIPNHSSSTHCTDVGTISQDAGLQYSGTPADLAACLQRETLDADARTWRCAPPLRSSLGISEKNRTASEIWEDLLLRRSVRTFSHRYIDLATVHKILKDADAHVAALLQDHPKVKILATVCSKAFGARQWNTYEIATGSLQTYGYTSKTVSLDSVFVNSEPADAPLIFWLCGDLRGDALRYRSILAAVGEQAHVLVETIGSFGLESSLIAGIWPSEVARKLSIIFCDEAPLLAIVCGYCCEKGDGHE
jgi:SagB-type dehydrogenase family enzyme